MAVYQRAPRGGNLGAKTCWHMRCRCCGGRRSLAMPLHWYTSAARIPKCRCGARDWRADRYRDRVELVRTTCRCANAPYPHRIGSAASGGRYGAWSCMHRVPF